MLGSYRFFPESILGQITLTCEERPSLIGRAIVDGLVALSQSKHVGTLGVAGESEQKVALGFHVRVAEGERFHAVGKKRKGLEQYVQKIDFSGFDFLVSIDFQHHHKGTLRRLRSDRYLLRFEWVKRVLVLKIAHVGGTMRMPAKSLVMFLLEYINSELKKRRGRPLKIKETRVMTWGIS